MNLGKIGNIWKIRKLEIIGNLRYLGRIGDRVKVATNQLGFSYSLAGDAYSVSCGRSWKLAELQLRIYWHRGVNEVVQVNYFN